MADIIFDLSGRGGLAEGFAGDQDVITPAPERIVEIADGQMAGGLFNQHLREGYLSPVTNTSTTVTPSTTPDTKLTAVAHDTVEDKVYFADRGLHIYRADSLTDVSLAEDMVLDGGTITDLSIYSVDQARKLFYVYHEDYLISETTAGTSRVGYTSTLVRIDAASTTMPMVIAEGSAEPSSSATSTTLSITVPSETNMAAFVSVVAPGTTVSGVTFGGSAMTELEETEYLGNDVTFGVHTFYITGITSGSKDVVVTSASTTTPRFHVIVTDNTDQTTPITDYNTLTGMGTKAYNKVNTADNGLYINFLFATDDYWDISTAAAWKTFDEGTQTGNTGAGIYWSTDGTKLYVSGKPATTDYIYQYTMSTPWDVSTAVYDTKTLDITSYGTSASKFKLSYDGTKLINYNYSTTTAYEFTLSTAWDISTASYVDSLDLSTLVDTDVSAIFDIAFSEDGLTAYVSENHAYSRDKYRIVQYNLSASHDLSTMTAANKYKNVAYQLWSLDVSNNDSVIFCKEVNTASGYLYDFNPLYPKDVSKLSDLKQSVATLKSNRQGVLGKYGSYLLERDSANDDCIAKRLTDGSAPVMSGGNREIEIVNTSTTSTGYGKLTTAVLPGSAVNVGIKSLEIDNYQDDDWLIDTLGTYINTSCQDSFMVPTDNGFAYLFTGNAVHKIDGDITGGADGTVTKNVLKFPHNFTITDAVDYRSKLYMALHQYPVDSTATDLSNHTGKVGIVVWNKNSVQLGGTQFIELPGVREIKKIYPSSDGVLKLLTISDGGLTQLRKFAYNDSGSVVFPVVRSLGIGGYPQFRDGLSSAGDKTVWVANDGNVYCEKEDAVNILHEIKAPGATTALRATNIDSGVIFYGSGSETAASGTRSNKQGIILSYTDSSTKYYEKIYPFDLTTGSNGAQTPHVGNVYTGVKYFTPTSRVKRVRIYNFPVSSTGTTVIATVKMYFNQHSTADVTKSVTLDEAKRGYVDFNISKPYVHSIQLEFEWATGTAIGADMYMPSVAIINTEETNVASPDSE